MENEFITLSSKRMHNTRFDLLDDEVQIGAHRQHFYYIDIRPGVCVLPLLGDQILLLREYRYPVRSWQWEIPGGILDGDEAPSEACVRELKEETGYEVEELIPLGETLLSFGISNEKIHLFAAKLGDQGEIAREPAEAIEMQLVPIREFERMITEGEFMHAAGVVAWMRYKARHTRG